MVESRTASSFVCSLVLAVVLLLGVGHASAGASTEVLQWIDRLQERLQQCHDYQYRIDSFERKGNRTEERGYRLFAKDGRLVRIKVVQGRGKGSEATLDAHGRVRGRKGGLLKPFALTLKPDDDRIRGLRGAPFWEAACHNFLKDLRTRITEPGSQSEIEPDKEQPGCLVLKLATPSGTRERYLIDAHTMHLVKGELFEGNVLVREFSIRELKENVGLNDDFFSF